MKTTNEILLELETLSENFSYNWENKNNFWKYEKKEWFSKEEINEAISEFEKYLIKEKLGTNIKFKFKDIFGDFEK